MYKKGIIFLWHLCAMSYILLSRTVDVANSISRFTTHPRFAFYVCQCELLMLYESSKYKWQAIKKINAEGSFINVCVACMF